MKEDWIYKRGDLYYANLNPYFGSEQGLSLIHISGRSSPTCPLEIGMSVPTHRT